MAVNKVNLANGETLVDLTGDSVTAETLAEGTTAHDASGNPIIGKTPTTNVLYTEQTLTEEQKAQARENIGAADISEFVITETIPSINVFNPNTATIKTVWNAEYCISDVIPCSVGDIIYYKYLNDAGALKNTGSAIWLVATNGEEVAITASRQLEYTVENHPRIPQLLGIKVGNKGIDFPIDEIGSRFIVTINTKPTEFVPWGDTEKTTNILESTVRYDEQELTEEQKAQARANIGAAGEPRKFSKVLVLGDSISADYYGKYSKWVTVLKNEGFFPEDTTNDSIHATGFVARYNSKANDFLTRIEAVANKDAYDLVVIFGGINDFIQAVPMGGGDGETDTSTYFKAAVNYFFNYLVNNFTQARIVILSPLRTHHPYPNTAGFAQAEYTSYIREVAKSYCMPVLNLTEESGFCPFNTTFRNMWTYTGYTGGDGTSGDGVHPSAEYEEKFLAPMIKNFLLRFI